MQQAEAEEEVGEFQVLPLPATGSWTLKKRIIFTPFRFRMELNSHQEPLPETYQKPLGIQISGHSGWEGKREAYPNK